MKTYKKHYTTPLIQVYASTVSGSILLAGSPGFASNEKGDPDDYAKAQGSLELDIWGED